MHIQYFRNMNKPILIVGAGISGCTLAERFANILNKKVIIIDKRPHIGGNCYDFYNKGVLVPKYGPHFFHTNDEKVWNYINNFSEWKPYEHRVLSNIDGSNLVPVPVNIKTVNTIFGLSIQTSAEFDNWLEMEKEKIDNPKNSEEYAISRMGKRLYNILFKNYTKKQWDKWPSELDPTILARIPIRNNFDDRYFTDKYQAMPKDGYTKIFERMINHPNIKLKLNTDWLDFANSKDSYEMIFFTGRIDQFFSYKYEPLEYRSLKFVFETINKEYFQERAQVNYPNTEKFTRITEPKHATGQKSNYTTIIKEYSTWEGEPYYPVPSENNKSLYAKYQSDAKEYEKKNIYFVGRLAEYKYFNMDQAFKNALELFERIINEKPTRNS